MLVLLGCAQSKLKNYEEFFDFAKPDSKLIRLPVVIVPGVKGSLLKRGDKEFWGKSYRVAYIHKFDELQFPVLSQFDDNFNHSFGTFYHSKNVRDGGVMEKYRIAFGFMNFFNVSIYENIRKTLEQSGGYSIGKDLFMFSYDWRLDNRISAAHLASQVNEYQKLYRENIEKFVFEGDENKFKAFWSKLDKNNLLTDDDRIKVNLVAHSMGGLVSRYYIQMLGGEDQVHKLIMLGTPNQGAMDALKAIAEGEFPESIFHFYRKKDTRSIIFSWPSTYQLLPRYSPCIKKENGDEEINLNAWGLGESYPNSHNEEGSDIVINNWVNHNLVPVNRLDEADTPDVLKQFLKEQLISAAKFHNTINGKIDRVYEKEKIIMIKSFGEEASIDVKLEEKFIHGHVQTPFIVFGGNCKPTLKYAYIGEADNHLGSIKFDDPLKNKADRKTYTMGDGRVPIDSLRLPTRQNLFDFEFLLCQGHASLVSNKTFQYNLLRELLKQAYLLN